METEANIAFYYLSNIRELREKVADIFNETICNVITNISEIKLILCEIYLIKHQYWWAIWIANRKHFPNKESKQWQSIWIQLENISNETEISVIYLDQNENTIQIKHKSQYWWSTDLNWKYLYDEKLMLMKYSVKIQNIFCKLWIL